MSATSLVPHLKRLRLSGILDTLPVCTQQAISEQRTYEEFLVRLIQDEVDLRSHKKLDLRIRAATPKCAALWPDRGWQESILPRPWLMKRPGNDSTSC